MYKHKMKDLKNIIIIGAGHAGVQVAVSLREKKYNGEILLFHKDTTLPYQKPPLSKKFLLTTDSSSSLIRSDDWFKKNNVKLLNGVLISKIDRNEKFVIDENNNKFSYDKLIIATGSKNKILNNLESKHFSNVITLRNLNDSIKLRNLITKSKNILIVGGGFIGLEVASIARLLEKNVTILESSSKVMGRNISNDLSNWYIEFHKKKGVNFLFRQQVLSLNTHGNNILSIKTSNNKTIEIDLLLIAIGSDPEISLAKKSKLNIKNGVSVNSRMQTNDPDIYAVGDCTNFLFNSRNVRLESIQNAVDQSKIAASNILKNEENYLPLPWFWSDQYDLKLQIVGLISDIKAERKIKTLGSKQDHKFSNFIFINNKLISVESINKPSHHILLRNNHKIWNLIHPEMINDKLDLKNLLQNLAE